MLSQSFAQQPSARSLSSNDNGTIRSALASMDGKLSVNRPEEWDIAIGMPPQQFYDLWTKDLPGKPHIRLEFNGGGQGSLYISSSVGSKQIFWAERTFDKPRGTMQLKEVRIEHEDFRRKGIGKVLLENQFDVAKPWGLHEFKFKAGRENGPRFWSRRGAEIQDWPHAQPFNGFKRDIENGLGYLKGGLTAAFESAVHDALAKDGCRANITIARLPGELDGEPMAGLLLDYVTEFHAIFKLDDEEQMTKVHEYLGDMDAVRAHLRGCDFTQNNDLNVAMN